MDVNFKSHVVILLEDCCQSENDSHIKALKSKKQNRSHVEANVSSIQPSVSDVSSDSSDCSRMHPVFMNDLILQEIFSFLNPKDYKRCRLVCQKWKRVGEAHFKNNFQLSCNFDSQIQHQWWYRKRNRVPFDFRTLFRNAQSEFPFRLVKFIGPFPLSTSSSTSFFANEGKLITHLTLRNTRFPQEDLDINKIEMGQVFLHECNIMNIVRGIESLKFLEIVNREYHKIHKIKLSLIDLKTIEYINLGNCTIELSPCTIAPIELRLDNITFTRGNLPVEEVWLNDFVEFGVMEKLIIIHQGSLHSNHLILNLVGNVTLKHLEYNGVTIGNGDQTLWSVNSLDVCYVKYTQRTNLKYEKLFLRYSKCDLNCLPQMVNELSIGSGVMLVGTELSNIRLPNIKSLELTEKSFIKICFPYLATSFNNLRELKLQDLSYSRLLRINVNQIPKSVETLIFGSGGFLFAGDGVFLLNSLIIEDDKKHNLKFIAKLTKYFSPTILKAIVDISVPKSCNQLIHLQSLLNTSIPRIMLGEVHKEHLDCLKRCPSFRLTSSVTGQVVTSDGSKITFSFAKLKRKVKYRGFFGAN